MKDIFFSTVNETKNFVSGYCGAWNLEKVQSECDPCQKKIIISGYNAWDLQKFQLVLDLDRMKNITVSGRTTSMKHETRKISISNRTPVNLVSIFFQLLRNH